MEETLTLMERAYRRFFALGMLLLLTAFALIIWRPLGKNPSLIMGMVLFMMAFFPLELARRIARKMALVAMGENRKA